MAVPMNAFNSPPTGYTQADLPGGNKCYTRVVQRVVLNIILALLVTFNSASDSGARIIDYDSVLPR